MEGFIAPESLPLFDTSFIKKHLSSSYIDLAYGILKSFEVDIDEETIKGALDRYRGFDDPTNPTPLEKIKDDLFILELYHGQTRAFKDMALQPFGYILSKKAQELNRNYLIMVATSGDTGPATLEAFKNQDNIKVVCLYPSGGTSDVQRLQMVTEDAKNEKVLGVVGNFDDTQTTLKELLASEEFREELKRRDISLSAANSVNFGRIIFQIIYHIYSYIELVRRGEISLGEEIYIVVPSGNFGNVLGGYYAKMAGVPIKKLLVSSNINNILTEFIETGIYDISDRELIKTNSPAMDILISSNVERLLFHKFGAKRTKELMESLKRDKKYSLTKEEKEEIQKDFKATFSTDDEAKEEIEYFIENYNYIIDPHTATSIKSYKERDDKNIKTVVCSTAEWTKFSQTVAEALGKETKNDIEALDWIENFLGYRVPPQIAELFKKEIVHKNIVEKDKIKDNILDFL